MFQNIPVHEETGLGLPYPVVLIDSAEAEFDEAGQQVGVSVPNLEGLVAAVAVTRALDPLRLDGREVRFIRRVIGMTAKDFAESLTLDTATFSRWENGKQELGAWADKQVRMAAIIALGDRISQLSLNPKDIIGLSLRPRANDEWPSITMILHPLDAESDGERHHAWDTTKLAA